MAVEKRDAELRGYSPGWPRSLVAQSTLRRDKPGRGRDARAETAFRSGPINAPPGQARPGAIPARLVRAEA
jgi:hypothetical protein